MASSIRLSDCMMNQKFVIVYRELVKKFNSVKKLAKEKNDVKINDYMEIIKNCTNIEEAIESLKTFIEVFDMILTTEDNGLLEKEKNVSSNQTTSCDINKDIFNSEDVLFNVSSINDTYIYKIDKLFCNDGTISTENNSETTFDYQVIEKFFTNSHHSDKSFSDSNLKNDKRKYLKRKIIDEEDMDKFEIEDRSTNKQNNQLSQSYIKFDNDDYGEKFNAVFRKYDLDILDCGKYVKNLKTQRNGEALFVKVSNWNNSTNPEGFYFTSKSTKTDKDGNFIKRFYYCQSCRTINKKEGHDTGGLCSQIILTLNGVLETRLTHLPECKTMKYSEAVAYHILKTEIRKTKETKSNSHKNYSFCFQTLKSIFKDLEWDLDDLKNILKSCKNIKKTFLNATYSNKDKTINHNDINSIL